LHNLTLCWCDTSTFTKLRLGTCCLPLRPFPTAGSPCTCMVLVVIIRPYTFESKIHQVAIESLWTSVNGLSCWGSAFCEVSTLCPVCHDTAMRFIFQFAFLHLQLQDFGTSAGPRVRACDTRPHPQGTRTSPLGGGVLARD